MSEPIQRSAENDPNIPGEITPTPSLEMEECLVALEYPSTSTKLFVMGGKIESYLYDFYNLKIRGTRVSKWDLNQAKIIAKILSQRGCQVLVLKIPVGDLDFLNKIEDIRRVNFVSATKRRLSIEPPRARI